MKLICWNIAGWKTKIGDQVFIEHLTQYEIIFLQETWITEDFDLSDYIAFHIPATPSVKGGMTIGWT